MNIEFDSEFCKVEYIQKDNVVLLTWKKFACLDDYRNPTTFALELLGRYPESNFVVDARNGFEDDKRDVEWGFTYLLPHMSKTTCTHVAFILNKVNAPTMDTEMDLWTKGFGKYFAVTKSQDYKSAIESTKKAVLVKVVYTVAQGKRQEFFDQVCQQEIMQASREEPGNISYEYYLPVNSDNDLCLFELWTSADTQKLHGQMPHYQQLQKLKEQYVENVSLDSFNMTFNPHQNYND